MQFNLVTILFGAFTAIFAFHIALRRRRRNLLERQLRDFVAAESSSELGQFNVRRRAPRKLLWKTRAAALWTLIVMAALDFIGLSILAVLNLSIAAASAAVLMCVWGVSFNYLRMQIKRNREGPSSPVVCRAQITVHGERNSVFAACIAAVKTIGVRKIEIDENACELTARTRLSWNSWYELIRVAVIPSAQSECGVWIVSDAAWPTVLLDGGKNVINVRRFVDFLQRA